MKHALRAATATAAIRRCAVRSCDRADAKAAGSYDELVGNLDAANPFQTVRQVADGLERVGRVEIADELVVVARLWRLRGRRTGKDAERSNGGCRRRHA